MTSTDCTSCACARSLHAQQMVSVSYLPDSKRARMHCGARRAMTELRVADAAPVSGGREAEQRSRDGADRDRHVQPREERALVGKERLGLNLHRMHVPRPLVRHICAHQLVEEAQLWNRAQRLQQAAACMCGRLSVCACAADGSVHACAAATRSSRRDRERTWGPGVLAGAEEVERLAVALMQRMHGPTGLGRCAERANLGTGFRDVLRGGFCAHDHRLPQTVIVDPVRHRLQRWKKHSECAVRESTMMACDDVMRTAARVSQQAVRAGADMMQRAS
jgi:hypothetical protein